jgi:polysaccharide export outer membrane protein
MRRFLVAVLILSWSAAAVAAENNNYTLNPGDVLDISVWREEDLQRQVLLLPDGTISFPLAGRISAAGRTTGEVQEEITQRLDKYIPDAVVTVSVLNVSGNKIYVIGAVNNPGEFQVVQPTNVMQALSLAGGLTPFAGEDSIKILRREGDQELAFPFHYSDVKRGEELNMNIPLKSGDVIVVSGESLF